MHGFDLSVQLDDYRRTAPFVDLRAQVPKHGFDIFPPQVPSRLLVEDGGESSLVASTHDRMVSHDDIISKGDWTFFAERHAHPGYEPAWVAAVRSSSWVPQRSNHFLRMSCVRRKLDGRRDVPCHSPWNWTIAVGLFCALSAW